MGCNTALATEPSLTPAYRQPTHFLLLAPRTKATTVSLGFSCLRNALDFPPLFLFAPRQQQFHFDHLGLEYSTPSPISIFIFPFFMSYHPWPIDLVPQFLKVSVADSLLTPDPPQTIHQGPPIHMRCIPKSSKLH